MRGIVLLLGALFVSFNVVSGLGSTCSSPLGAGTAGANDAFWMQNMAHQGKAAYAPNPSTYQVFRSVKDFGAKGDGVTDDTAAIKYVVHSYV